MITIDQRSAGNVFGFRVTGKITRDDYRKHLPRLEEAIREHGKISVLVHLDSPSGIELGALWEELKFDLKHFRHIDRVALVGDRTWHERSVNLASHLTPADGRHFPSSDLEEAWDWIRCSAEVSAPAAPADKPVRRILVPTDFSANACTALNWAIRIAKQHEAHLSIFHVAPVPAESSLPTGVSERIAQSLTALKDMAEEAGLEVTTRWRAGKPWELISAASHECDLVVIGARGHTPLPHLLLGSTADRVLRAAAAPVLTVHQADDPAGRMPRRVLVPTDFSASASHALEAVLRLFDTGKARLEITLLHAWQPLTDYERVSVATPPPIPHIGTVQQATEILETLASKVRTDSIAVTTILRQGYAAKVIGDEAAAIGADLIAMGTHGHSGLARLMLGSIAERVIHHARCPVLSIGSEAAERVAGGRRAHLAAAAT